MAAFHLVDVAARQRTVVGVAAHAKVHVAFNLVGVAAVDKLLDKLDHLGDFLRSARAHVGVFHVQSVHVVKERLRVLCGNLGCGAAFLVGFLDDFVVHVGDVGHELHLKAAPRKVATDDVEANERAGVADVDVVVHRGAAHVHADFAVFERFEGDLLAQLGVVDFKHWFSCSICSAALRGGLTEVGC